MQKVRFGKTGLMVSRIAFGGIPIERLNTDEAVKVVARALDLGVNFIDTANGYTDSEEKIGLAIKGIKRDSLVIATKSFARDKKTFLENLDLSLKRLGTDYIDVFQHHSISSDECYNTIMAEGGAYEGMLEAIKAGKVRFPAFTSHDIPSALRIMRDGKFYSVQLALNYIDDDAAKEAVPLAKELDMGFIAMKPFGGGLLPDAKLAIKYLLQFDNVIPDPGIERISEIEEIVNIVNSGEKFSPPDTEEMNKLKKELGDRWCHRCDYCKPCPQGIMISGVLSVESFLRRLPYQRVMSMAEGNMNAARGCNSCGQCMSKCPYKLNIPELIKTKIAIWDEFLES